MRVVGVNSGTSGDGIDVLVVDIDQPTQKEHPRLVPVCFQVVPFTPEEHSFLMDLLSGQNCGDIAPAKLICDANMRLGRIFAKAIMEVLDKHEISPTTVDIIASHGQTVWHQGPMGTLQLGESAVIAYETGITTISDFRVADVAAGGEGAPLMSMYDWMLLRTTDIWRVVQNIGGIANVTFLPPIGDTTQPLAFDTGCGNVFIDYAARVCTNGAQQFDEDGKLAANGKVQHKLLEEMLQLEFFHQKPPKTTGRELFTVELAEKWLKKGREIAQEEGREMTGEDFVATTTELTSESIAIACSKWAPGKIGQFIVSGGGSRNGYLMKRLRNSLEKHLGYAVEVVNHDSLGVNSDAKEAALFALLGWMCIRGMHGNVPACTGASSNEILGKITPGKNFHKVLRCVT